MAFETLSDHLRPIAQGALAHCKHRYGSNGVKFDEGIDASIRWRPTFFLKASKYRIVAVEVDELLYPEVLRGAAYEIIRYDFPIQVYQACSLDSYQRDPKGSRIQSLVEHGFGIITVDTNGNTSVQKPCIPLAQHIPNLEFERSIRELNGAVKRAFRSAYESYELNESQGLQASGKIIESLVRTIATKSVKKALLTAHSAKISNLADLIDEMYSSKGFQPHRAALGGARNFVKSARNTSSHAPKSIKEAIDNIRACRGRFFDSIDIAIKLSSLAKALGISVTVTVE